MQKHVEALATMAGMQRFQELFNQELKNNDERTGRRDWEGFIGGDRDRYPKNAAGGRRTSRKRKSRSSK